MRFNQMKYYITICSAGILCFAVSPSVAGDAIQVGYVQGQALQPIPAGQPVYQEACPNCQGRKRHRRGNRFLKGIFTHKKLHSADQGWSRIVKQPVRRSPVAYRRYWPSKWAGQPGFGLHSNPAYPMVYMPTDTTQLGYYYQRAPQWMPNPGMIPPAPHPYDWHRRECPMGMPCNHQGEIVYHQSHSNNGYYAAPQQVAPQQAVPQQAVPQPVPQAAPVPAPLKPIPAGPQEPVPPNPVEDKSA